MMRIHWAKLAVCAALLTAVAAGSEPANACSTDSPHRRVRLAKGTPTQIPILDGDLNRSSIGGQYAMQRISAPAAQMLSTGAGITVAVLDGGFDLRHEALQGRLDAQGWDFLDADADPQDLGNGLDGDLDGTVDSLVGHGTFVSSIILGVAPDATILPIRVLDDEGWGTEATVAAGLDYAVAHGAKVVNMSLVVPDATQLLQQALRNAADAGVLVVGAAGNDPLGQWQDDPAIASRVLAMGAVDETDTLLGWSETGWNVDAYAPGRNVVGALGGAVPDSYAYWSGTSFSAAFASGGAALVRSRSPSLTPLQVAERMRTQVDPAFAVVPPWRGRINLLAALLQ